MRLPFFPNNIHSHYTSHQLQSLSFNPLPHVKPVFRRPSRGVRMDSSCATTTNTAAAKGHLHHHRRSQKEKVVVIMGATGSGKSGLSIDLATRFFPSEIINSDKIQVYNGLDITTNKIPIHERLGVPHHLLGEFDPDDGELTTSEFRLTAGLAISDIASRQKLPLVVGGSNSFIHALLVDRFNPDLDVFHGSDPVSTQLRYNCCFIWVDVSFPVLCDYLCKRVDEMLDSGMFEELSEYHNSGDSASQPGLRKAIGVPEFDRYFRKYPPGGGRGECYQVRRRAYEGAVREIKDNTCQLAKRQIGKILRLKGAGWDLHRVDATEAFKEVMMMVTPTAASDSQDTNINSHNNINTNTNININYNMMMMKKKKKKKKSWERDVLEPSVKIVKHFLEE